MVVTSRIHWFTVCIFFFVLILPLLFFLHYSEWILHVVTPPEEPSPRSISESSTLSKSISPPSSKPYVIHIVGERHSGTKWIEDEMNQCFGHAVNISSKFFRWKHWWQSPSVFDARYANYNYSDSTIGQSWRQGDTYSLVIALFRDPYDWIEGMRVMPHHAINHWDRERVKPLSWKDFVTRPWTMKRVNYKQDLVHDLNAMRNASLLVTQSHSPNTSIASNISFRDVFTNYSCYEDFFWFDITPCSKEDRKRTGPTKIFPFAGALYELQRDGSGKPFQNILQLRREKLIHFYQELRQFPSIQHYFAHLYEDLVRNGTQLLLRQIEEALPGITAQCRPSPPKTLKHASLPQGMLQYLNRHIDWDVENMVGYQKRLPQPNEE